MSKDPSRAFDTRIASCFVLAAAVVMAPPCGAAEADASNAAREGAEMISGPAGREPVAQPRASEPQAQAGTVGGSVRMGAEAVPDARVTLFRPSLEDFHEVRSDAEGAFAFTGIEPGGYRLGAAAVGYGYEETDVDVGSSPVNVDFSLGSETHPGLWDVIGDTLPEVLDGTNIGFLLADGTLLYCHNTVRPVRINPVTGAKLLPPSSGANQGCSNVTLDPTGRALVVAGSSGSFRNAVPWFKAYDPVMNNWQWLPPMLLEAGRYYPGLARLADGSLLVMGGGMAPNAARTNTCEVFSFATGGWTETGAMLNPTDYPPAALLYTGEVLITWWPAQLYNPQSGQWRAAGGFGQPNRGWPGHCDHSMIVLADGRALILGVRAGPDGNTGMGEIYDPQTDTWSLTANPDLIREWGDVAYLPDGRVLLAGGRAHMPAPQPNLANYVKRCDLYDPANDSWRAVAEMINFRDMHAITLLLPDGRVTITGGTAIGGQTPTAALEAYSPPYLFRGVRPQITTLSHTEPARGQTVTLEIFPESRLTSLVLMGVQSMTHWVTAGIPRRLVLEAEQEGSTATVTLPADPNLLPLGYYMLFAMVDDIPSKAVIIRIVPAAILGDLNGDGVVDEQDLAILAACTTGPRVPYEPQNLSPDCTLTPDNQGFIGADFDRDGDVDHDDFAVLQRCYSGTGLPQNPDCAP